MGGFLSAKENAFHHLDRVVSSIYVRNETTIFKKSLHKILALAHFCVEIISNFVFLLKKKILISTRIVKVSIIVFKDKFHHDFFILF